MIICSCNALSDLQVRDVLSASGVLPQTAGEVQRRLGCRAQCGCCARTLKAVIEETRKYGPALSVLLLDRLVYREYLDVGEDNFRGINFSSGGLFRARQNHIHAIVRQDEAANPSFG